MNAKNWKVGMSSCCTRNLERETFEGYANGRIDCMEISLPDYAYADIDFKQTRKLADEYGVELWSFHLPFSPFEENNIASPDKEIRRKTVEMQSEYIKKFSDIGIKIGVIHPSGEPNEPERRREYIEYAKESLASLAEVAGKAGAVIAVEDLPRTCLGNCSSDIKELISADSRLKVCYDTNHLLEEKNSDFIKAVGDKIVTVHVSDYDFVNERHWLPYEGKNDWVEIVSLLEEAGYEGPFMYEIAFNAPPSIERRTLTFDDFKENYIACINKVPAKVLGKPLV